MIVHPLFRQVSFARVAAGAATLSLFAMLTGCGLGGSNLAGTTGQAVAAPAKINIMGQMHGGFGAINGATIQLYEVGATGYAGMAKPILTAPVTTLAPYGSYSITLDYTCDAGTYVYLTGSGGNAGAGTNNNIALMAALGPCAQVLSQGASKFVTVNEVTTVAAAYALAQFSGGTAFGTTLVTKPGVAGSIPPADNFATSATNTQGIANAMAVANVLVNTTSGTSPGSNTNGSAVVENYTINTVANLLSVCVQSSGGVAGDGTTPCGILFSNATPAGGVAPADTIQLALQFALHPGDAHLLAGTPSGSVLDSMIAPQGPYFPYVNTTVPGNTINDWTVAVSYAPVIPTTTTTLLNASNFVAIDGFGNAWVTNTGNKAVVELAPNGDPIQSGAAAGTYSVTSYSVGGAATNISGGAAAAGNFFGIGIDNNNNAWAADYGSGNLFEVTASGAQFNSTAAFESTTNKNGGGGTAAPSLYTGSTSAHPIDITFDANNDLFATLYGNGGTAGVGTCGSLTSGTKNIVTFPYSGTTYGPIIYGSSAGSNQTYIAIDNGTQDTAGGSALNGSPFVWFIGEASGGTEGSGHYGSLYQASTQTASAGTTSAASTQGCNTALGSISGSGSTDANKLTSAANGGDAAQPFNNAFAVAFDASNNLWSTSQAAVDTNGTDTNSFTKLTPAYGASQSSANFVASTSFVVYAAGGELASGFKAQSLAIDGNGSAFGSNVATKPTVAAVSNTGTALAPSTGFTGATYASSTDGINYTGLARPISTSVGIAVDPSGNLWVTSGAATLASSSTNTSVTPNTTVTVASVPATNVVQIVGVAAPVQTPLAAAAAAHNLGGKP